MTQPPPRTLAGPEEAARLFAPIAREPVEVLAFAYLGADLGRGRHLLGLRQRRSESAHGLDMTIREVAADALAFGAEALVMAHNHPCGDPTPSDADHAATRRLAGALDPLGVRLMDHLVLAEGGVTSFRTLGLL
ncbi:JAB domain-containing protein [Sphingomonas canadensis]|uniref:JAB domain-containing protein n=1 Tax=Sphingomonas canadensis TaxID=1219257 RepID=A0ABW3H3J8_9SPHN|nr:JAB domain-containing protein [Sphingomonas canadensis]MCW3835194.1 DNA repair protein [Sphingomonas canadensis]